MICTGKIRIRQRAWTATKHSRFLIFASLIVLVPIFAAAQTPPRLSDTDRIRLREAFRLGDQLEDEVWPGWHKTPFAVLLVTSDYEFLIRHPNPSSDFTPLGNDLMLGGDVYYRKRQFSPNMQATFPAVNGVNTIVIGQAELTFDKTSTRFVATVMHERFHQFVYSQPAYFAGVAALGLDHGDTTGMWMLNYPFPYDSPDVQEKFSAMIHALSDALAASDADLDAKTQIFRHTQQQFRGAVPVEAERYLAFQLWQEGVARYTELRIAELAAAKYKPTPEFMQLPDYKTFDDIARSIRAKILDDLRTMSLAKTGRIVVYSTGAGEAMLLDRVNPKWQSAYFQWMTLLPAFQKMFRLPDAE
jgi:hypothetical protein